MPKDTVTGLRAAAAALDITRQRLQRYMAAGLPHSRKSERVIFDLSECRAWLAINDVDDEDESPKLAPTLHPSDPRFRASVATAKLKDVENLLEAGRLLVAADVRHRIDDEGARFTAGMNSLHGRCAGDLLNATAADVQRVVDSTIEQLAKDCLTCDLPGAFGDPVFEDEDDSDAIPADVPRSDSWIKILAPPDPRYDVTLARAVKRERALEARYMEVMPQIDAVAFSRILYAVVRRETAKIGQRARAKLAEGVNDPIAIRSAINTAVDETYEAIQASWPAANQECSRWIEDTASDEEREDAMQPEETADALTPGEEREAGDGDSVWGSIKLVVTVAKSSAPYLSVRVV